MDVAGAVDIVAGIDAIEVFNSEGDDSTLLLVTLHTHIA
jgi:hypothetical protein